MSRIRVSDVDRDRACVILREHFAVGRLNEQELSTRVAAAQSAVTWDDVQELLADLPPIPGMSLQAPSADGTFQESYKARRPTSASTSYSPPGYTAPTFGGSYTPNSYTAYQDPVNASQKRSTWSSWDFTTRSIVVSFVTILVIGIISASLSDAAKKKPTIEAPKITYDQVEVEIASKDPSATVDEMYAVIDGDKRTGNAVRLPYRVASDYAKPPYDLEVYAQNGDNSQMSPAPLTCTIKVNGEIVAESSSANDPEHECYASFKG
ncbi:DUF1707 SHOCT-like domain-containing protein [Acrocarpospora catenulata]|uniref:DUF1707 SHOCT-like domain-containing protein n=1 Tax=Acrocarpospora catenulata TaxID=2836182 RepID=UPI001BDB5794|nr:DUF1707 domain-containing protein [Acrocarpospora catenulata]